MPYSFKTDLSFALTLRQAKNHALHFGAGAVIAWGFLHFLSGSFGTYAAIVSTISVAGLKEWIEALRRTVLNKEIHVVDSALDFVGWVLGALLVVWLA